MLSNKPLKAENYSRVLLELDLYAKVSLGNQSLLHITTILIYCVPENKVCFKIFLPCSTHTCTHISVGT